MGELTMVHESVFSVQYQAHRGYPATFDEPGKPDTAEIISITLYGVVLTPDQQDAFILDYGEADLQELCLDDAQEQAEENRADCVQVMRRWAS